MIRYLWEKMMKWGWDYNRDLRNDSLPSQLRAISLIEDEEAGIDLPDPIRFKVQSVSGGTLVETRWYDPKKDEARTKLHIITQEENLADAISKIITMELLQK